MDEQSEFHLNTPAEITAYIIAAYVSGNRVQASELPALISSVYAALSNLRIGASAEPAGPEKPTPAEIKKSISPDHLISFLDGKPYKTLKRHLAGNGLTIEEYRERYGLPRDYPSVSASYSAQRSELAKSLGLGQQRRNTSPKDDRASKAAPKARGRKAVAETA